MAVLAAADRMNFIPNAAARALASGRAMVIAVYAPYDVEELASSPFFAPAIVAISTAIAADAYALLILRPRPEDSEQSARELIRAGQIDGVIMIDPEPADRSLALTIIRSGLPVVTMGSLLELPEAVQVDGDVFAQLTDALDHLNERGYKHPALITFPGSQSYLVDSSRAYADWTRAHDIDSIVCTTRRILDRSLEEQQVVGLLATPFDSLVCVNDSLAIQVSRELQLRGRDHVGAVGLGNSRQSGEASPPLTSIETHTLDRARLAAESMLQLIAGKPMQGNLVTVPHHLVVRQSTPRRDSQPL